MRSSYSIAVILFIAVFSQPYIFAHQTADVGVLKTEVSKGEDSVLFTSRGFERLLSDLNDHGKRGYKFELAQSAGGEGVSQTLAVVMRLAEGEEYEYDLLATSNRELAESALNEKARTGYKLADTFALTYCGESDTASRTAGTDIFNLVKGDIFLLERKKGDNREAVEYKVLNAKIGLGRSPTRDIQTALDNIPAGFKPVKVLFSKTGMINFVVSVLLEKTGSDETKTDLRFIKEVTGFEKKLNALAKEGYEFIYGRRIGMTKFVLMARRSQESFAYTFVNRDKYTRDFDKRVAAGYNYHGVMFGDVDCGSGNTVNEQLVFEQNPSRKPTQQRILELKHSDSTGSAIKEDPEFQKLIDAGYEIQDIFYAKGFHIVLAAGS